MEPDVYDCHCNNCDKDWEQKDREERGDNEPEKCPSCKSYDIEVTATPLSEAYPN